MRVTASAPGKVILFGEHSVVYRGPAVVLAIDKRVTVSVGSREDNRLYIEASPLGISGSFEGEKYTPILGGVEGADVLKPVLEAVKRVQAETGEKTGANLSITSELPVAVGLGSSAATAVATVAAISALLEARLTPHRISLLAFEVEKLVHGTPSGIDNTVACYGGGLIFDRNRGIERLDHLHDLPLIVGNTGIRRSTARLVDNVRELRERNKVTDAIIDTISHVAELGKSALLEGDLGRLGELMSMNHGLLWALGVSHPQLDRLVNAALEAGALGAKLTGAGGGGCMLALPAPTKTDSISKAIEREGGDPFIVHISNSGVDIRKEGQ